MTKSVFAYRNGALCVEALPLSEIAESVDTPFYCTSAKQLQRNYRLFAAPFAGMKASFHYSVKANANLAVIRVLADCGAGAEISSAGELERALEGGITPDKIVFSGLGKTDDDIAAALLAGIMQINVESISELLMINTVADVLGIQAPVALRINPDPCIGLSLDPSSTGKGVKVGINFDGLGDALQVVLSSDTMVFKGLAVHVEAVGGSYANYREYYKNLAMIVGLLREQGISVDRVDLGGGIGISCDGQPLAPFSDYASIVYELIAPLNCAISFESGRSLVGNAGVLVTRIIHVKETEDKTIYVVDAGLNDLLGSALHNTRCEIISVRDENGCGSQVPASIVGPLCDAKDTFGDNYMLPPLKAGDLIAVMQTGAFGSVMSSSYGGRPLIPEVLVSGAQHAIVRRRVAVAEQMGWESIPDWMVISRAA